jgi:hypothetical protein
MILLAIISFINSIIGIYDALITIATGDSTPTPEFYSTASSSSGELSLDSSVVLSLPSEQEYLN